MSTLAAMRERLEAEQALIQAEIEKLDRRLDVKPDYSLGTGDPAMYQWELNLALREQSIEKLKAVQAALSRIADGSYGKCTRCDNVIEAERLELLPSTLLCSTCARKSR
jgi:DnaK suppressor protein